MIFVSVLAQLSYGEFLQIKSMPPFMLNAY